MAALAALAMPSPRFPGAAGFDALQRALMDFGKPCAVPAAPPSRPEPAAAPVPLPAASPLPSVPALGPDIDALVTEAVMRAEAALRERLEREHRAALEGAVAQALAEERERYAAALAETAAAAADAAAPAIDAGLSRFAGTVADGLAETCARLLLPVIGESMTRRALDAMAGAVREALEGGARPRVTVSGPRLLLAGLQARLSGDAEAVQWRESLGFDLSADFDGQVVETRLAEWAGTLREENGQ